jgi:hypothetical protein
LKFIHRFSKKVSCVFETPDTPPERGTIHDREIVWTGQPKRKHLTEYIAFQNEANRVLSNFWDMKLMHCFRIAKNKWQFWAYEPNKAPRLIKVGDEPEEPFSETNHSCIFDSDEGED